LPRRIDQDHKDFKDVYGGIRRRELKKYIKNGSIFRNRGKDGKIVVTIPKIDIPHIVYGESDEGIGRGKGEKGEVIGKDPQKGDGKGNKAGQDAGDGIDVSVDLEEVLKFMQEELELPEMKPKPSDTYEQIIKKYNNISLVGPESLRHNGRTIKQALKRQCADGSINKLHQIPGFANPIRLITPINSDKRYRQFNEIKIPSSNAVLFFARDGSASMDQQKCDIVSDMCWWIDVWTRRFYSKVERVYVWHDTVAKEVDEKKFYKYRYGGGTTCSTALKLISKMFENRFNPVKWNIYLFYFTDGENYESDNEVFVNTLESDFNSKTVNMVGITQILPWSYDNSLKQRVDVRFEAKPSNIRTTQVGGRTDFGGMSETDRDGYIKQSIMDLLGKERDRNQPKEQSYWSNLG
jgi:uncharacterized sporulation protein YeaH/YhbH (DUF444 family)